MYEGMVKGFVSALDDPYTEYYTAEEAELIEKASAATFYGINATVIQSDYVDYRVVISDINEEGGGYKAGLRVGDVIYSVDGEDMKGCYLSYVVAKVRGEAGTTVKIQVVRNGSILEFDVVRGYVETTSVTYKMLAGNIGYISFTSFDEVAEEQMRNAITELNKQGMKSLIMDIRGNGGGDRETAINIIDMFIDKGLEIGSFKYKDGSVETYKSENDPICTVPMVLLVNGYSASASDLMASVFKQHSRATIIGTTTYGKGCMQTALDFSDGSYFKITVAEFFGPNETAVHGIGTDPDVYCPYVEGKTEGDDNQLDAAIEAAKTLMAGKTVTPVPVPEAETIATAISETIAESITETTAQSADESSPESAASAASGETTVTETTSQKK